MEQPFNANNSRDIRDVLLLCSLQGEVTKLKELGTESGWAHGTAIALGYIMLPLKKYNHEDYVVTWENALV